MKWAHFELWGSTYITAAEPAMNAGVSFTKRRRKWGASAQNVLIGCMGMKTVGINLKTGDV